MAELLKFSDELVDEFWQPIDVFSVCQCTTSAFRPISRPTLIKWFVWVAHSWRRMVKSKDLRTVKVLFITSRGVEFEAGSPYEGWDSQEPAPGMLFNTWV